MRVPFRQGIVTYPVSGKLQNFLASSGAYVTLLATNGRTDIAFSHGSEDYLLTESVTVQDAWGPLPSGTDCWLYWDIDKRTAVRTFGFTTVEPLYGETAPSAVADQHWFDTVEQEMRVYTGGQFREVIRVFAAKFNNSVFTPMGYGFASYPYAGSQVGLSLSSVSAGRILVDDLSNPIRRSNGHFFTTEHDIFVDGSPVTILRLESTILTGTAQFENLSAYQVVTFSEFGEISHAEYADIQSSAIAILLEDLNRYDTGTVCLQGHITNLKWNWVTVGAPLWIDDTGALVEYDPHVNAPLQYPTGKSPIARVITQHSVMFDQGLGGKGDIGPPGSTAFGVASDVNTGVTRLSVAAADTLTPIAVGDNDPRMSNARPPLAHTHPATAIIPTPYGSLTGANLQLVIQQIDDGKVAISGSTMTGALTLSSDPINAMQAATKQYVDTLSYSTLPGVVPIWNQDTTGTAAHVTTNASLTGEVTSVGNAATLTNSAVIGKVLTGYTSGAGTVAATDSIVQAVGKLNGNDALKAPLDSPALTGTPTAPTATVGTNTAQLATTAFVLANAGSVGFTDSNFITGLIPSWVSGTAINISSGKAYIPSSGTIYDVPGQIALTGLSLSASTMYYLYLYDNAGTPAVEVSTTIPVIYGTTAANKTGDTSRRCLGSVLTDASSQVYRFRAWGAGNKLYNEYVSQDNIAPFRVINGGTATTPTSVSISGIVPAVIFSEYCAGSIFKLSAGGDATIGIGYDMDATVQYPELTASYYARFSNSMDSFMYLPPKYIPISGLSIYYQVRAFTGTCNLSIDTRGYSVNR